MIWLGAKRGYVTDWLTQLWVRATGRHVSCDDYPWLVAPIGDTRRIGAECFRRLAEREQLVLTEPVGAGILPSLANLDGAEFDSKVLAPAVRDFYEHTSAYQMDAWSHWCGPFRPFGWLLATIFSRRLQQLNVPLSGLDTSRGLTNTVWHLIRPHTGEVVYVAWIREMLTSGHTVYAGSYSVCTIPGTPAMCLRVAFPLPNGNALVFMKPQVDSHGALSMISSGRRFGDPGFYFTVRNDDSSLEVRYLSYFRESIRVYPDGLDVRADHVMRTWGMVFLKLHYRLRKMIAQASD